MNKTNEKWVKMFVFSTAVILLVTGSAKIISALDGKMRILFLDDPIFDVSFRNLMLISGIIEIGISMLCFFVKIINLRIMLLVWLSSMFLLYRIGLWLVAWQHPCPCLGNLTGAINLSSQTADLITRMLMCYMLFGGLGFLFWRLKCKALSERRNQILTLLALCFLPSLSYAESPTTQMVKLLSKHYDQGKMLISEDTILGSNDEKLFQQKKVTDTYYLLWSRNDFVCASLGSEAYLQNSENFFPLKAVENVCVGQWNGQKWQSMKNILITYDTTKENGYASAFAGNLSQVDELSSVKDEIFRFGFPPFSDVKTETPGELEFIDPTGIKYSAKMDVTNQVVADISLDAYGEKYKISYSGWITNGDIIYPSEWLLAKFENNSYSPIKRASIKLLDVNSAVSEADCSWGKFLDMRYFRHLSQTNGVVVEVEQSRLIPITIGGHSPPPMPSISPKTARVVVLTIMFTLSIGTLVLVVREQFKRKNK